MRTIAVVLWTLVACTYMRDYIDYEGLRLDISALTMNRDILSCIIPALNRTWHSAFPRYKEEGQFGTALHLKETRIRGYKIQEDRIAMNRFEYKYPIYRIKGGLEAIYFVIAFNYELTWLGIPVDWGSGFGAVTNVKSEILVLWNETEPDVQLPHPWDVLNLTANSWLAPISWLKTLLHRHFIPDFHTAVDYSMHDFAHNLLKAYKEIEDIFPDDVDLIFRNQVQTITPTINGEYFSIAFKTNLTVNTRFHKRIYRKMRGTVTPKGDFDYCLAAQLVPNVLDVLGKGSYTDHEIDYRVLLFETNTIREFFRIMPELAKRFTGTETFTIFCSHNNLEFINDVTDRAMEEPLLELQDPQFCLIYVPAVGDYVLTFDVYFRLYYELTCKVDTFYARVLGARVYSFKTAPDLAEGPRRLLEPHILAMTNLYYGKELMSPGIRITPTRSSELQFDWAYNTNDEICFYYRERRPLLPLLSACVNSVALLLFYFLISISCTISGLLSVVSAMMLASLNSLIFALS